MIIAKSNIRVICISIAAFFSVVTVSIAQTCTFACNDTVNISVDRDCQVVITPDMVLEGSDPNCSTANITVFNASGASIGRLITREYVGTTLRVRISDATNSCDAYIKVEDKLAPEIVCPPNDTLMCDDVDYAATNASLESYLKTLLESTIIDNCGDEQVTIEIISNELADGCSSPFSAVRNIEFRALDNHANAEMCSFDIYYQSVVPGSVDAPKNYTDAMSLNCTDAFPELEGRPYPTVEYLLQRDGDISIPNINGVALANLVDGVFVSDNMCNFMISYSDQEFPSCGNSYKIVRTWLVQDWCDNNPPEFFYQVIKVADNQISIDSGPSTINASADPSECNASVTLDRPSIAANECSNWSWEVAILEPGSSGFVVSNTGLSAQVASVNYTFPLGESRVQYTVNDDCGNTDDYVFSVIISDDDEPMAVCDLRTAITLNEDFNARVFAQAFDDGSFDGCSDITYKVRRVDGGCGSSSTFDDFVKFCCEDYGKIIEVELQVEDENGFVSSCTAEAVIQFQGEILDIVCPENPQDMDCSAFDNFDPNTLTAPMVLTNNTCIGTLTPIPMVVDEDIDECGVGFKNIEWTILLGEVDSLICTQRVNFINLDPFDENDISWPSNRTVSSCGDIAPTETELSSLFSSNLSCSNVIYSEPQDRIFENLSEACVKVLRTWTIVDWCQYPQNPNAIWTHVQTIIVENSEAPDFAPSIATIDQEMNGCNSIVTLTPLASDDCTADADLIWTYKVDLLSGNSSIEVIGSTPGSSFTSELSQGTYQVTWTVMDLCGNTTEQTYAFDIIDSEQPVANCISSIEIEIDGGTEIASLSVDRLDSGSFDQCGAIEIRGIRIANTQDLLTENILFDCDEVGDHLVEFVVEDNSGNRSECLVNVTVSDNAGVCTPGFNNLGLPCGFVMDFDGTDDYVGIPTLSIPETFTVEAVLFYRGNEDNFVPIVEFGQDNPFIGFQANRPTIFGQIVANEEFPRNTWTHIAFTYNVDANSSKIYINGELVKTGAANGSFTGTGLGIGHNIGDLFYNGKMDELRIWDFERTEAEILNNINDNLTGREDGLVAYYDFNAVAGILIDQSSNFNTGTLAGLEGDNQFPQFEQVNTQCTGGNNGSSLTASIFGSVYTPDNVSIESAQLSAEQMDIAKMSYDQSDVQGVFAFNDVNGNAQYALKAEKNDDYTNGVSTLDLIMIQMHILGIQPLESPYQMIAADASNNKSLSSIDLVLLRQLILGIIDKLPENDSWRFVNKDFELDPNFPYDFEETITIGLEEDNIYNNDFIGIKIGDVNGSAIANSALAGVRDNSVFNMSIQKRQEADGWYFDLIASENIDLLGFQFQLSTESINSDELVISDGMIRLQESNYDLAEDGARISWHSIEGMSIPAGERLFSLKAHESFEISIEESNLFNQIYDSNFNILSPSFEELTIRTDEVNEIVLFQNQPNPFTEKTYITFELKQSEEVSFELYDMKGQKAFQSSKNYGAGSHTIELDKNQLGLNKGIHYYQIKTQKRSLVRKMIVI